MCINIGIPCPFLPTGHGRSAWLASPKIALLVGLCVPSYHMHNSYVTCIVVMPLCLVVLTAALSTGITTMSSLAQLLVLRYSPAGSRAMIRARASAEKHMCAHYLLRSRGNVGATCEADHEQKCQKQAATHDAYKAVNKLRMAAREPLKGSEGLKAQLLA